MPTLAERPEFLPPPEGGLVRSFGIAVVAHVLLLLALSVGLQWKRDDDNQTVEAELWSPTVQQAAPKAVEVPPAPPPPAPAPVPAPPPPAVQPPPPPPQKSDADIVQEREKQRQVQEQARRDEEERQRKLAAERKRQDDLKKQELAKKEAEERKREEQQAKARKEADDRKREEQAKARKDKQQEERVAKLREENLRRMQGLAGATGGPSSTGTALQSSGPSTSYAGRVRARVKPNIVFTDNVAGNPSAEVEVRLAPDGTIVGRRLSKASGVASWDDAVLRAIDRTEVLPRDIDGRVPSSMILVFRPKDL